MSEKDRQAKRDARAAEVATKPRVDASVHNHADVKRLTPDQAAAQDEGPDSPETQAAHAFCGKPWRVCVGPMVTAYRDTYDVSTGWYKCHYYTGKVIRVEALPGSTTITGPQTIAETVLIDAVLYDPNRPKREGDREQAFQAVECGQDEAVLRNLARHSESREPEANEVAE